MNILRNILAVILGWLVGSALNMGLIQVGHNIYPIEGLNPNDMEALAEIMPTLGNEYYIFPFLAHALGALVGAFIAAAIAKTGRMKMVYVCRHYNCLLANGMVGRSNRHKNISTGKLNLANNFDLNFVFHQTSSSII